MAASTFPSDFQLTMTKMMWPHKMAVKVALHLPQHHSTKHYSCICGDTDISQAIVLPDIEKDRAFNYVLYVMLDNESQ